MGTMYDAVSASRIPLDAQIVAGYINGRYRWTQRDWDRFPHAVKVRILVYIPGMPFTDDGDVLDVEAGNAPQREAQDYAARWVNARIAAGIRPVIYTSKSGLQYLGKLPCQWWISDPNDVPHLLPGTVATQYAYKGVYDVSVTADGWPTPAATKGASPMPGPNAPCAAFRCTPTGKGYWMVGTDGGVFTFGDAEFFGSLGNQKLNNPISGMEITPSGKGYWLYSAADYGVFAFGDAEYLGHPGA